MHNNAMRINALEFENLKLRKDREKMRRSIESFEAVNASKDSYIERVGNDLDKLRGDNDKLRTCLEAGDREIETLREKQSRTVRDMNALVGRCEQDIDRLYWELESERESHAATKEEVVDNEKVIHTLRTDLDSSSLGYTKLVNKMNELKRCNSSLEKLLDEAEDKERTLTEMNNSQLAVILHLIGRLTS